MCWRPIHYLTEVLLKQTADSNPVHPLLEMVRSCNLRISQLADDLDGRTSPASPKVPV